MGGTARIEATVVAVLTGRVASIPSRPGSSSAIDKRPVAGSARCGPLGFDGDEQADRRVHGGPVKAVHVYPREHYEFWREELGPLPLLESPGAFGENIHLAGLTEREICIGDRFRVGSALLEISQGRQPCWKLGERFGVKDMALRVERSRRAGWYCRVLEPGVVGAGDCFDLLERPYGHWSVDRLLALMFDRAAPEEEARSALALPLPESWRLSLEKRLQGAAENADARRQG